MARPKQAPVEVANVEEVAPVEVANVEEVAIVKGVEVETAVVSISIEGVEYFAKDGVIIVPSEFVELVKSHG